MSWLAAWSGLAAGVTGCHQAGGRSGNQAPLFLLVLAPESLWASEFFSKIECIGGRQVRFAVKGFRPGRYEKELRAAITGASHENYDILLIDPYTMGEVAGVDGLRRVSSAGEAKAIDNFSVPVLIDVSVMVWKDERPPENWQGMKQQLRERDQEPYALGLGLSKGVSAANHLTGFANAFGGDWQDYSGFVPAITEMQFLLRNSWRNLPRANHHDMLKGLISGVFSAVQVSLLSLTDFRIEHGLSENAFNYSAPIFARGRPLSQKEVWRLAFPHRGRVDEKLSGDLFVELTDNRKAISETALPVWGCENNACTRLNSGSDGLSAAAAATVAIVGLVAPSSDLRFFRQIIRRNLGIKMEQILEEDYHPYPDLVGLLSELAARTRQQLTNKSGTNGL